MLWGYFDESGTDGEHGFTVISGFIGPITEWSPLVRDWDAQLLRDGIETFHCVDCKGRNKAYLGWTKERSLQHREALAETVTRYSLGGISAGFVGDYRAIVATLPPHFQGYYPTAYSLCFELVVNKIRQAMHDLWTKQPVALIFSHHQQFSGLAIERWALNRKSETWQEIGHIGYAYPKKVHQLQVADMIAWETRRFMTERSPPTQISELPLLARLVEKHQEVGGTLYEVAMDEAGLRQFAEEMPRE